MSSRSEILKRIDRALGQVVAEEAPSYFPRVDVLQDGQHSEDESLVTRLRANLERLDAILIGPEPASACSAAIVEIARNHQIRSALISHHPLLAELAVDAELRKVGIDPVQADDLEQSSQAGLGVSVSEWAVCSTGTLVSSSHREKMRSASLLPPVSILLQPVSGLLPDMNALFSLEAFRSSPGAHIFVTGPSRTGDIELTLTKGVHGPGKVFVLLVEPSGTATDSC